MTRPHTLACCALVPQVDSLSGAAASPGVSPASLSDMAAEGLGVELVFPAPVLLGIGYISRRFEDYPGTPLMMRMFQLHDRSRFKVRLQCSVSVG